MKTYIELIEGSKCVNVVKVLDGGRKKEKLIRIEDFVSSITASLSGQSLGQEVSPIFREIRGVRLIQSKKYSNNSTVYVLFQERHNTPIQFFNRFYDNVGVPNLLYAVHVVNNKLSKLYVVATKDTDIGNNGIVCLGRNTFEEGIEDNNLRKLFNVPYQFMSMPNNLDHYRATNNSKCLECEELIKSLVDKDFDDELLIENNITQYSQWFEQL